jgi:hypothetical protein
LTNQLDISSYQGLLVVHNKRYELALMLGC